MAMIATANQEDALDIVQDAMLKLAVNYADRTESEWGPLFHRIVQSTILDWYRRQKVRNHWRVFLEYTGLAQQGTKHAGSDSRHDGDCGVVSVVEQFADHQAVGPVLRVANERSIEALDAALHQLPLRQQQAFLLRAWEGLSVEDTAEAMGCSQGSVKTHYSRAVHALRTQLEDHY
jgi:RNA polymerase sigma-70 factor (ECF subfamily)